YVILLFLFIVPSTTPIYTLSLHDALPICEEVAIHAIRGLRSIVHGFISLEVAGGFAMPVDLEASFHWLINLFIAGLSQPTVTGEKERIAMENEYREKTGETLFLPDAYS